MKPARIGMLVSGGGRTLENLVHEARAGRLALEVALVLADRPGIGAFERAARLGVPLELLDWKQARDAQHWSALAFARLEAAGCELCVLGGFLRRLVVPSAWRGRVLNIHPSLLPAFGGRGMYGEHVHAAVLASKVLETGCTVHYVDDEYDHGQVLLQRRVPVLPGDTPHTLAARVFEAECQALPEALRLHWARQGN